MATKKHRYNKMFNTKRSSNKRRTMKRYRKKAVKHKYIVGGVSDEFAKRQALLTQQLENPDDRQANMLNAVCNSTTKGACVDFMTEYRTTIKNFFNNYYIKPADNSQTYGIIINRIGNPSANGFILQIQYERSGYSAFSAIKANQNKANGQRSDSLLYEYYVGTKFINDFLPVFPCFVETYKQLYFFNKKVDHNFMAKITNSAIPLDSNVKSHFEEDDKPEQYISDFDSLAYHACKFGKKNSLGIMIQHFANFNSLDDVIDNNNDEVKYDVPSILLQVYFVLNNLKNEYTHYDLHGNNVFLYKPYLGERYIEMNYHFNDGKVIKFPTEYIVKIIDYGRNYFSNTKANIQSLDFYNKLCLNCKALTCMNYISDTDDSIMSIDICGQNTGVFLGEFKEKPGSFYNINPSKHNMSHDLRLLTHNLVKPYIQSLGSLLPGNVKVKLFYEDIFGTPEVTGISFDPPKNKFDIKNVTDMCNFLKTTVDEWNNTKFIEWKTGQPDAKYNKYGKSWTKMGEMHIYEDRRPFEFTASSQTS